MTRAEMINTLAKNDIDGVGWMFVEGDYTFLKDILINGHEGYMNMADEELENILIGRGLLNPEEV
jgi:hypothetical protein